MFRVDQNLIEARYKNREHVKVPASEINKNVNDYQPLTLYPRLNQTKSYRTIDPVYSYVPIRSLDIFYDAIEVIEIEYKDNYYDTVQRLWIDPMNKIYTTNKGYIASGNLGMMDVLYTDEGRVAQILNKNRILVTGDFFKMELRYGNNILVNGLTVIPK